jgi:hypothetical protein
MHRRVFGQPLWQFRPGCAGFFMSTLAELGSEKGKGELVMKKLALMPLVATLILAFSTKAVIAQEKAKTEKPTGTPTQEKVRQPDNVLFENERVRVAETRIKPGERN